MTSSLDRPDSLDQPRLGSLDQTEFGLEQRIARATGPDAPPGLALAIRHAVFPGGARVRPLLCLAVAAACGASSEAALPSALAVELLHCASLVHDDLPCFDDAPSRRGRPSVQARFGEALAVLAGDALIVLAFEAAAETVAPGQTVGILARAAGSPHGLVAGQAWESEGADIPLGVYQRAKTASLFAAAAELGAMAAGGEALEGWRLVGTRLGAAYQVADDIRDVLMPEAMLGKPSGRDRLLGRPNALNRDGFDGARRRLEALVSEAAAAIPPCRGEADLRALIQAQLRRLLPDELIARAA